MKKRSKVGRETQESSINSEGDVSQDLVREAERLGERYTKRDFFRDLTLHIYEIWLCKALCLV